MLFRSLPVDLPAPGPAEALGPVPGGGGGVGGPQLDGSQPGGHQQREELRPHEGLRAEQAGQRALRPLPGRALTR